MKTILDVCAWCSDTLGTTLFLLLVITLLPALLAVTMLLFVCAVPVGVVYKIVKSK